MPSKPCLHCSWRLRLVNGNMAHVARLLMINTVYQCLSSVQAAAFCCLQRAPGGRGHGRPSFVRPSPRAASGNSQAAPRTAGCAPCTHSGGVRSLAARGLGRTENDHGGPSPAPSCPRRSRRACTCNRFTARHSMSPRFVPRAASTADARSISAGARGPRCSAFRPAAADDRGVVRHQEAVADHTLLQSEDCLYLNVFAPQQPQAQQPQPQPQPQPQSQPLPCAFGVARVPQTAC